MGWLIEAAVNGIIGLMLDALAGIMNWVTSLFSGVFGSDPTAFITTFPIANNFLQAFYIIGFVLCVALFMLACVRNMFSGLGFAGENPFKMVVRFLLACCLVVVLPHGMSLIYASSAGSGGSLFGSVYDALGAVSAESMSDGLFDGFKSGSISSMLTGGLSSIGLSLVMLIFLIIIGINVVKLLLEMTERYLLVNVLVFFSPLAGAAVTLESTIKVFSSYLKMFFGQMLMLIMNLISCKLVTSGIKAAAESLSYSSTISFPGIGQEFVPFILLLLVVAMLKICQRFDNYLRDIGITVGVTGGSLMDEISAVGHGAIMSTATGALFGKGGKGFGGGAGGAGAGILAKAGMLNTGRFGNPLGGAIGMVQDAFAARRMGKDPTSGVANKSFAERFAMAGSLRRGAGTRGTAGLTSGSRQKAADTVQNMMNSGAPVNSFAARAGGNAVGFNEMLSSGRLTPSYNPNGVKLDNLKDVRVGAGGAVGIDKDTGHMVAFTTEKPAFESSTLTTYQGENGSTYYAQDLTVANQEYQAQTGVNYSGYVDTAEAYQSSGAVDFRESSYRSANYSEPTKSYRQPRHAPAPEGNSVPTSNPVSVPNSEAGQYAAPTSNEIK